MKVFKVHEIFLVERQNSSFFLPLNFQFKVHEIFLVERQNSSFFFTFELSI